MEDKMFDLMTQMYSELQTLNGRFENLENRVGQGFAKVDDDISTMQKDIIRLETKLDNHSKALFDGYTQYYQKLRVVEEKLDALSNKVERQDMQIKVIKNVATH